MMAKIPRRIVTADDSSGKSIALSDGPAPDVLFDPPRPGFISPRILVTDAPPVEIARVTEAMELPHSLVPPPRGSVCRIVTFPPDDTFRGKVGAAEVAAFFHAMNAPAAS